MLYNQITILFEAPFWIAIIENFGDGNSVAREVIGTSAPTGAEMNPLLFHFYLS